MQNTRVVRKVVEMLAKELKSSTTKPSDADLYIGFKFGDEQDTPVEEEDVKRDSGGGIARLVMKQITPIK